MRLARRLSVVAPSPTLAVTAKAAVLRARGLDIISFGAGEPDFETPAHIREAVHRAIEAGETRYTMVRGTPALRAAVAEWLGKTHGLRISPEEVIVGTGAKQCIYNALMAVIDDGDDVLIPTPVWGSYHEMVKLAGGRPVSIPTHAKDGFELSRDAVARAIGPRTRAIMLCSPSNPTGAVYARDTVEAVASLAVEHDLLLLTDDVYRTLVYGNAHAVQPASLGSEVQARTVIIDGVSKAYAMTGWRIGFAVAARPIVEAMETLQGQCTTNASSVSQAAALAAITGPTDEVERMRTEYDRRRLVMVQALQEIPGMTCVEPHGAFYAFPNVSAFIGRRTPDGQTIDDDGGLCEYLMEEARVAVVPGSAFHGPGHIRLSYATSMDNIVAGMARITAALRRLV